jgi:hypothetical protein
MAPKVGFCSVCVKYHTSICVSLSSYEAFRHIILCVHVLGSVLSVHPTLVLVRLFYALFCYNDPFNLYHFLICSLIFGITPFDWLRYITLNPYFWWKYNFWFMPFLFTPTFSFVQLGWENKGWVDLHHNYLSNAFYFPSSLPHTSVIPGVFSHLTLLILWSRPFCLLT